jgi:hypothetical protein
LTSQREALDETPPFALGWAQSQRGRLVTRIKAPADMQNFTRSQGVTLVSVAAIAAGVEPLKSLCRLDL